MNLETLVDKRLWKSVQSHYESKHYSSAIIDAIFFLGDIIREKTSLEADGVALVNKALGGNVPKLKINKFQTQSEKDEQKGICDILRGIYSGIRNPRSHEQIEDSQESANAIILFINFLIGIIDKSKNTFSKETFLQKVFDPHFVPQKQYADLLVEEIPDKLRFEIIVSIFSQKENKDTSNIEVFIKSLYNTLTQNEIKDLSEIVSDELMITTNQSLIEQTITIFPKEFWNEIDKTAKIRIENLLISRNLENHFELNKIFDVLHLKDNFIEILISQIDSSWMLTLTQEETQKFTLAYYYDILISLDDKYIPRLQTIFLKHLKMGRRVFFDFLWKLKDSKQMTKLFNDEIEKAYKEFKEPKEENSIDDDLPF